MRVALACAFVAMIVVYLALTLPAQHRDASPRASVQPAACLQYRTLPTPNPFDTHWPNGQLAFAP